MASIFLSLIQMGVYASKLISQVEDKNIHALRYKKPSMCIVSVFLWGRGMEAANRDPSIVEVAEITIPPACQNRHCNIDS